MSQFLKDFKYMKKQKVWACREGGGIEWKPIYSALTYKHLGSICNKRIGF